MKNKDLVFRQDAIDAIRDRSKNHYRSINGERFISIFDEIRNINAIPFVPAVPLDKLCPLLKELNESGYSFQCAFCKKAFPAWCEEKNKGIGWDKEFCCPTWEEITEWMVELDAD